MRIPVAVFAVSAWLTLSGCETINTDNDRPARIVNPDEDSREALQAAIDEAVGPGVLLADDALTKSSLLTIERCQIAGPGHSRRRS